MTYTPQTFMEAATRSRLNPEQVVFVVKHYMELYRWHLALANAQYKLSVPEIGQISALVRRVGTAYERVTKGFATSRVRREDYIVAALIELESIVDRKTTKRRAS